MTTPTVSMALLLLFVILSIPIAGVLALASYKMKRLELYSLAVMASVLAMLPCHREPRRLRTVASTEVWPVLRPLNADCSLILATSGFRLSAR